MKGNIEVILENSRIGITVIGKSPDREEAIGKFTKIGRGMFYQPLNQGCGYSSSVTYAVDGAVSSEVPLPYGKPTRISGGDIICIYHNRMPVDFFTYKSISIKRGNC